MDEISLKWGTLKAWNLRSEGALEVLEKMNEINHSMSAMEQDRTGKHNELLCELIDAADCETIYLDWDGVDVSKEKAKEYIMGYEKKVL